MSHGRLKGLMEPAEEDPGSPVGILGVFIFLILLLLLSWIF